MSVGGGTGGTSSTAAGRLAEGGEGRDPALRRGGLSVGGTTAVVGGRRSGGRGGGVRLLLLLALLPVALLLVGAGPRSVALADDGPWTWPLAGPHVVSRPFAPPAVRYGTGHRGVDLPAEPGAVVRAAGAGRVSYAGLLAGRGVVVVVHGTLRTTYEPVLATVRVGGQVEVGEPIGRLEPLHGGCPVSACLHWGLRRGEEYLDPVRLVRPGPVRLLPQEPDELFGPADLLAVAGGRGAAGGLGVQDAPVPAVLEVAPGDDEPSSGQADVVARTARERDEPPTRAAVERLSSEAAASVPRAAASAAPTDGRPQPPAELGWSLRRVDAPLGAAALAALVAGVFLLTRPRLDPDDPPGEGPALRGPVDEVTATVEQAPVAPVLDLDSERQRRRSGGAP